jgi:hypothetical protein
MTEAKAERQCEGRQGGLPQGVQQSAGDGNRGGTLNPSLNLRHRFPFS